MTNAHEEVSNALWMHRGSLVDLKKRAVHHRSVGPEGCVATFGSMRVACGQLKKLQQTKRFPPPGLEPGSFG